MDDEDSILPHKLQTALEYVLEKRKELASDRGDLSTGTLSVSGIILNEHRPALANNIQIILELCLIFDSWLIPK